MKRSKILSHAARIWTFDGGGPSVISQLIIVNEIMYRIQWTLKLHTVPRPCDYADLMVGTGLGAIAVILMTRLCLTAEDAMVHIINLGKSVFVRTDEAPIGPLFDIDKLKSGVTAILEQHGLSSNTKMIEDVLFKGQTYVAVLTTSAANLSTCRPLRTYSVGHSDSNPTIVEAIMATMATPKWFEPVTIGPPQARETLIGGAMGFNNPTSEGLEEAKRVFGPDQPVAVILSLGSGRRETPRVESSTREGLTAALERAMMDSEKTAGEMSRRLASTSIYYRFSVDKELDNPEITGWEDGRLGSISSCTKDYNEQISSSLDAVVELLLKKKGLVTMGQIAQAAAKAITAKRVPALTPYYVPREDVYEAMKRSLLENSEGSRLFVLCGMAGVGKTQSSSYYESINYKKYDHVFFIDASSATNIEADLQSATRSLGGTHSQDTYEDALRFLSHPESGRWLMIMDNADDPNLPLRKYLPHSREGSMIITTRNPGLIQLAPSSYWRLIGMEEKEATSVLFRSAQLFRQAMEDDEKYGREICVALGGLPLALVQAGNYCFSSGISFHQYLERLKRYRSDLMNTYLNSQVDEYNYSAYASIRLSYSLFDDPTKSLLHMLAFFHPSSIRFEILRIAASYHFIGDPETECLPWDDLRPERLEKLRRLLTPNGEWNEIYVDKLLHQLQSFSLVSLSSSTGSTAITIHPLIQSCIQDALSAAEYRFYFHMAAHMLSSCIQDDTLPIFQHLAAHISEIESRGVEIHVNDLTSFAYVLICTGSYEDSMKRWERVKEECSRIQGHEHRSTLRASFWRANCLYRLDFYKETEAILREVVVSQGRTLGEEHDHPLESYELLAWTLTRQGKTKESELILKRLLTLYEKKCGSEHFRTLRTQSALAGNLSTQNNDSEAEAILRSVIPVMKGVLGEDNEITLLASNRLSLALINQGKWKEAEAILGNLVILSNTVYGKEHPTTLKFLFSLSLCLQDRKDWTEVERIQREVLEIRERTVGKNDPSTIETLKSLQETLRAMQESNPVDAAPKSPMLESTFDPQPTNPPRSRPSRLKKCLRYLEIIWIFVRRK